MTENEWQGDMHRRVTHIEREVTAIKSDVASIKTKDAVADVHRSNVETRLASIEGSLTWLVRLVLGALILALVGFALSGGLK